MGYYIPTLTNKAKIMATNKLTVQAMWGFIEMADWANNSQVKRGYDVAKLNLINNLTLNACINLNQFITRRFNEMYDCINLHEKTTGDRVGDYSGDDSFGDMIHHAIGLGEQYYNSVMENPELLNELACVESFAYAIPRADDYENMKPETHIKKAKKAIQELARIVNENDPSREDLITIRLMMDRLMLIAVGNFPDAIYGWNDEYYNTFYMFEANDKNALFSNVIGDVNKWFK